MDSRASPVMMLFLLYSCDLPCCANAGCTWSVQHDTYRRGGRYEYRASTRASCQEACGTPCQAVMTRTFFIFYFQCRTFSSQPKAGEIIPADAFVNTYTYYTKQCLEETTYEATSTSAAAAPTTETSASSATTTSSPAPTVKPTANIITIKPARTTGKPEPSTRTTLMSTPAPTTRPTAGRVKYTWDQCGCFCVRQPDQSSLDVAQKEKEEEKKKQSLTTAIKEHLALDVHKISAARRRHESVVDDRSSSQMIGLVGVTVCVFPLLLIVLSDIARVLQRGAETRNARGAKVYYY